MIMALKMKEGGSFETFHLYTRLDGVTLHKTLCFILRIVFLDRRSLGITARHIANYVIYVMYSRRIYWCH